MVIRRFPRAPLAGSVGAERVWRGARLARKLGFKSWFFGRLCGQPFRACTHPNGSFSVYFRKEAVNAVQISNSLHGAFPVVLGRRFWRLQDNEEGAHVPQISPFDDSYQEGHEEVAFPAQIDYAFIRPGRAEPSSARAFFCADFLRRCGSDFALILGAFVICDESFSTRAMSPCASKGARTLASLSK